MTKEEVLKIVKEEKIESVKLCFTDILGKFKTFSIIPRELEKALGDGLGFDGSSIVGMTPIEKSDMMLRALPETMRILPWKTETKTSAFICEILNPDGSEYEACPRFRLKKAMNRAKKQGFEYFTGPELEFFYFKMDEEGKIKKSDEAGYFDARPFDEGEEVREETVKALEKMGIEVECDHHEVAPGQHEIDLRYDNALVMADKVMFYKLAVKEIARKYGFLASFMPKPIFGENGSGMHTHQSLFKKSKNAFFDKDGDGYLSDLARKYIAGLIKHSGAITAICNQYVNSYKRLVPGFEAPVYKAWARRNRSAMIRVPAYNEGQEKATRIELRSPDPSANPYLAFAVMLSAGLAGIEGDYEIKKPCESNIYKMDKTEKEKAGIFSLPENLRESLSELKKDEVIKKALGEHIFESFSDIKQEEWDEYRTDVSEFEIGKFIGC